MSPLGVILLLALAACSPYRQLEDPWPETAALCALPEPYIASVEEPLALPPDCAARIDADLGIDAASFGSAGVESLAWLREAAVQLMSRDIGELDAVELDAWVQPPLLAELEEVSARIGSGELRHLLYTFTAHHIETTRHNADIQASYEDGLLLWGELAEEGVHPTGVLFHEASHAVTPGHVLCPGAENQGCDSDWDGAYGYQAGALRLWALHLEPASDPTGGWAEQLAAELAFVRDRVLAAPEGE